MVPPVMVLLVNVCVSVVVTAAIPPTVVPAPNALGAPPVRFAGRVVQEEKLLPAVHWLPM